VAATSVVIEAGGAAEAVARICADFAAQGQRITTEWRGAAPGVVCTGVVSDAHDAEQAVLAVLAGGRLVVVAAADREVIDRMCDDLRRLGPLDHRVSGQSERPELSNEEWALVDQLLAGASLGDAARAAHLSRRTADRRVATARRTLGVTTTAELLAAAARIKSGGPSGSTH
jgi:DNA-binding NarL/FixJ family response regulator